MEYSIEQYGNEKRINSIRAKIRNKQKEHRRKALNRVFHPLLDPLTQNGNDIARAYLFRCMTDYIPESELVNLRDDYIKMIKPFQEGRSFRYDKNER